MDNISDAFWTFLSIQSIGWRILIGALVGAVLLGLGPVLWDAIRRNEGTNTLFLSCKHIYWGMIDDTDKVSEVTFYMVTNSSGTPSYTIGGTSSLKAFKKIVIFIVKAQIFTHVN